MVPLKIIQNFFQSKNQNSLSSRKKFVTRSDESIYLDYFTEKFLIFRSTKFTQS